MPGPAVIVLDASATVDWLLQTPSGRRIEQRIYAHHESLHTPHLMDVEAAQTLRRLVREGKVTASRAAEALRDLIDLPTTRYAHFVLLPRIWHYRNNLSAYDAVYVVLAETLGATLITRDARLAAAPGHTAKTEVF